MKEVKSGFVPLLEKTFFARPKIGFFISLSLILIWSYYSYINYYFNVEHWYNVRFLANTWYELMVNKNYIYVFIPLLSATAIGRFLERAKIITLFDSLVLYIGSLPHRLSQSVDSFKVDDYVKITITKDFKEFIKNEDVKLLLKIIYNMRPLINRQNPNSKTFGWFNFSKNDFDNGKLGYDTIYYSKIFVFWNHYFVDLFFQLRHFFNTINSRAKGKEFLESYLKKDVLENLMCNMNNEGINYDLTLRNKLLNLFKDDNVTNNLQKYFFAYIEAEFYDLTDCTLENCRYFIDIINSAFQQTISGNEQALLNQEKVKTFKPTFTKITFNENIFNAIIKQLEKEKLIDLSNL